MSDFVQLARKACKGKLNSLEDKVLSQRNWIRLMMDEPLEKTSSGIQSDDTDDNEIDTEDIFEDSKSGSVTKDTGKDLSAFETFLKTWIAENEGLFMTIVNQNLYGERPSIPEKYEGNLFNFYSEIIITYSLADFKKDIFLHYRGDSDSVWSAYLYDCIRTLVREIFAPWIKSSHMVKISTFTYRAFPNKTVLLFSENADVSCIKDKSLQLKLNSNKDKKKKVIANLAPSPGLKFDCKKEYFESGETWELSMVIKNFCTRSEETSYADEYQDGQFLSSELFRDCTNLVKVELSDLVKVVESDCFIGCSSLETLVAPLDHHIVGEYNYPFKVKSRTTYTEVSIPDEKPILSTDSPVDMFGLSTESPKDDGEKDDDCDDTSDNGEMNMGDEDESKSNYNEGPSIVNDDEIRKAISFSDTPAIDDEIWTNLQKMPEQLFSEILYCTWYAKQGLPKDFVCQLDKDGFAKIRDVKRYLSSKLPEDHRYKNYQNWSQLKKKAGEMYYKVKTVSETIEKWSSSKNDKIKKADAILFSDRRPRNTAKWFIQLLQGKSFAKIAEIENNRNNVINKAKNNNKVDENIVRDAISPVFDELYKFINHA